MTSRTDPAESGHHLSSYPNWPTGNVSLKRLRCGLEYLSKSEGTSLDIL